MIKGPQQQEIEIPLINSMSSTKNSSTSKQNLSRNSQNLNYNKTQRRVIQIPQENLKPRIFLLTKPSTSQSVRLETQTVQPHHVQNQKIVTTTPIAVASQNLIEATAVPFLPRSQGQTYSLKSNCLKQSTNPVLYQIPNQVKQFTDHNLQEKPVVVQQVIQKPPLSVETSNNQLKLQQESLKNTIAKSTVTNINVSSENEYKVIESQDIPLTLASMAGIELTGADMSLSQADMSGAMPPTATVEEINVPVFIDEYLHRDTASTSQVTTNNTFNTNTNNNKQSNTIGNEVNNFLDTLDNFEFDINLLTENSSKDKKTDLVVEAGQLTEMVGDQSFKQHELELQMMFEKILFDSNNNNNETSSNTLNNNNSNNNNNNINNMAGNIELTADDLFKVAPYAEINDFLSPDDIENCSFGTTQFNSEEAVDLNSINKDFSLDDCFINSQPTEIMFSCGYSQSQSSSQNLINEISKAEPHIAIAATSAASHMADYDLNDETNNTYTSQCIDENSTADNKEIKSFASTHLKRHSSQNNQHMMEKRLKLRLDTKLCKENIHSQQFDISTPKVIDFIDQYNDTIKSSTVVDSSKTIYNELISSSPKCGSIKSEIIADDIPNDFSPPSTPYSINSISNQTSFINTTPTSPASSIATTSNNLTTVKRGRGRPAKTHSDIPDHTKIQHLSESEQKKVLERAKNNEASRKSRLKHKERDNALEREEIELKNRNIKLQREWEEWIKTENKLKAAVKHQYFQLQNNQ